MYEQEGQSYGAYTLEKKESIHGLNATGYIIRHNKTKARIVVVSNEDNNKVFSIGFRTPPKDDTGTPHIMEHSVLCGSKEFPAKDPFVELVKGSLNTFLNAMTYPDKTIYPIASCNLKDYRNLMHVYLDAVFYPNIYQKPEILKQEGWHYELEQVGEAIKYNGVVYNEMKGVYSSPEELLMRLVQKSLLSGTPYEYESGGDPEAIPDLTQEAFLAFHQMYYHPSNSYIYLYGDMDFETDLAFMDEHYLSQFDEIVVDSSIPLAKPFTERKRVEMSYSVADTEEVENNTFLAYNTVVGTSLEEKPYLAFQILDYVLLSSPGAPLKKALIDAGIGEDVYGSYDNSILQPTFSVIAKNANPEDEEVFLKVLQEELERAAKGLDRRSLEAAINYFEFKYKEANFGRFPKGLMYGLQMLESWLYDDTKPFIHVKTEETFAFLKEQLDKGYFEGLITDFLLKNPHQSLIVLTPKKGLNAEKEEQVSQVLQAYQSTLSEKEQEALIADTKALKEYQAEPSTKEELLKIPMLTIDDIDKKCEPLHNEEVTIADTKVVKHHLFTNGIAYVNLAFSLAGLAEEDYSWASLLTCLYEYIDTEHYNYKELSNEINIETGGIYTGISILPRQDGHPISILEVKSKVLYPKQEKAFTLMKELILTTKLSDQKRLKEIIAETRSRIQMQLSAQGHSVTANRAMSYFSETAYKKELVAGVAFYEFVTDLSKNFDAKAEAITRELERVSALIYQKQNLIVSYTADLNPEQELAQVLTEFTASLYEPSKQETASIRGITTKNEGFQTASQVQYVATAGNYVTAGYVYTGSLKVLQVMFSYDYLWNNIRVKGGAYGCMCGFGRFGDSYFTSYRDPNLMETYDIYLHAADYVAEFNCDDRDMTKYMIGAISSLDIPLEPSAKGARSFSSYLMGITEADIQRERDELLATRPETIRTLAPLIRAVANQGIICAVGAQDKLKANEEHFGKLLSIF